MKVTLSDLLVRLGLGKNTAKAYSHLHNYGECTASEVASAAKIPRTKVYSCLRGLVAKGFAFEIPSKPRKFKAVSIETLKSIVLDQNKLLGDISESKLLTSPIFLTLGQSNVMRLYPVENARCKKENISIVHILKSYAPSLNKARQAIKRGVKMKILAFDSEDSRRAAFNWREMGAKVSFYSKEISEGLRFSVFDAKLCRITLGRPQIPESENYATVWLQSEPVAGMLREYFYQKWKEVDGK